MCLRFCVDVDFHAHRGVKKSNARMSTSAMLGLFKEDQNIRQEFFSHIERRPVNF